MHLLRAMSYLRQAEIDNCVRRHNRECCIFPLQGGGLHSVADPTRRARDAFLDYLRDRPDDLGVRWLVNVCSMALGDHPNDLPERFRIQPEVFASEYDIGRFPDAAPGLGLDTFNLAGGVIVEDFDGDGWLDIVTSSSDPAGPLSFFRNLGDGRFADAAASSGLDQQLGGLDIVGADFDNDADVDILVLRGAWLKDDGRIRKSLLRNEGGGRFTDVTRSAGLADALRPTQAAAWGDYDSDGDLDVYIGHESFAEFPGGSSYPSQLFRNNGDGTFTDIAAAAGVTNDRMCKAVAAGDYDNDGDLDIYASNIGRNRLYRNNGDGKFTDVAPELGVTHPEGRSFTTWFFDFDNDGWLDIFVAAYDAQTEDIAADYMGLPDDAPRPCLYRNTGGRFANVAREMGLDHAWLPMGANFGDLDNDGWLDIYLGTGDPDYRTLTPNVMLRSDGGRRFQDVTTSGGFGHLQKGHGVAFADLDHDGDQDIYHELGGFFPGDRFRNVLFVNPGHGNRFVVLDLRGTDSNRRAVGARIAVTVRTADGAAHTFHRAAGCVSSFGGSPLRQEIGLGQAQAVETIDIVWPRGGQRQTLRGVPLDAMIRVTEGREGFEIVQRGRFDLLEASGKAGGSEVERKSAGAD
jgi:hypothetical protein